jgi:hypothetical protein
MTPSDIPNVIAEAQDALAEAEAAIAAAQSAIAATVAVATDLQVEHAAVQASHDHALDDLAQALKGE